VTIPRLGLFFVALLWAGETTSAQSVAAELVQRPWFEARTPHFHTYSCGPTQEVARLAARLEQFRIAYSSMAGTQAVASPPIVVMAFPDHASLAPFLPVYQGHPANLAAFFSRGSDENLIVLSLSGGGPDSRALEAVFHEYAHLLLRHNELFWPLWLKEGMADIYGTFEVMGPHSVRIGQPTEPYLSLLAEKPLMSLRDLFGVHHGSPEYNERERQGIFYAESWLLTHYLMLGDNPQHKVRFGQLTALLRQGQPIEQAFTNTFRAPLSVMETQLRAYLQKGRFEAATLAVPVNLGALQAMTTRRLAPVETCFRLGDQLLRIGQTGAAQTYFDRAQALAPRSPLPCEGLGLLAADRDEHAEAARLLGEAIQRGSGSFLAHYVYARERFRMAAKSSDTFTRLPPAEAAAIRVELQKSLVLMPEFGPAHHLLGILELVQRENASAAEDHLLRSIQLEPENQGYPLTLAQAQLLNGDIVAARRTLEGLRRPYIESRIRKEAEAMLGEIGRGGQ
jgi:Flp pilus assembly protein TadD